MDIYKLIRNWWDYCFENPEIIKPIHSAIYFFAIEHCNRLGWKEKFGFPSQMVMDAIGVKSWRIYINAFNDIVDMGFFVLHQRSKNQYSSNIIALTENAKALDKASVKALDKATIKASAKHQQKQVQEQVSTQVQYNNTNILYTNIPKNQETNTQDENCVSTVASLMTYFSFSEIANFDKLRIIDQFVTLLKNTNRLDHFKAQFEAYKLFKDQSGQIRHGFKSFIGSIDNHFADGGWNAENWSEKLKSLGYTDTQQPYSAVDTARRVADRLKSELT